MACATMSTLLLLSMLNRLKIKCLPVLQSHLHLSVGVPWGPTSRVTSGFWTPVPWEWEWDPQNSLHMGCQAAMKWNSINSSAVKWEYCSALNISFVNSPYCWMHMVLYRHTEEQSPRAKELTVKTQKIMTMDKVMRRFKNNKERDSLFHMYRF